MSDAAGTASRPATAVAEQPEAEGRLRDHTVLVTGATGFVGTRVCRELARSGARVRGLVRSVAKAAERLAEFPIELHVGDIRDATSLGRAMRGCTSVVHLAAIAIERPGQTYDEVNARGTERVLAAMRAAGVRRLVHMSQNFASSTSPYRFLRSKGMAEDAVRASQAEWTVLCPSVIFGPQDEFVNVLARLVRLSPVIYPVPGGGSARFQPISVDDVARVVAVALGRAGTVGRAYPLGGPAQLTLRQMVERVLLAMEARRILVPVPTAVLRPVIALFQRILPNPPVTTDLLDLLAVDNVVEGNALRDAFGIVPTPFAPEELEYLRAISAGDAFRSLLGR
ncbi:MAG TPA: complex I NDUFA9 subunit family protein [Gemmatimonadaceae bacterium]|nr:complex I NDUFA9 subunit family protein [Gemmatimonadaceae bacterium]